MDDERIKIQKWAPNWHEYDKKIYDCDVSVNSHQNIIMRHKFIIFYNSFSSKIQEFERDKFQFAG